LGDSYLNFLYSMALSEAGGKPTGARIKDRTLVDVAKATGIRSMLPSRTPKGRVADSIEALIMYTWLRGVLKFEDMMEVFRKRLYDPVSSLEEIVREAVKRLT
ncbi:MAG: ribonuclease III family protein, partial [Thermoproteota archaeon]